MTIKTATRNIKITLSLWKDGCGPDCFGDLESNFARSHACDDDGRVIATDAEVDELIGWWEEEVENANKGISGDGLEGLTAEGLEAGAEWMLKVEG